MKIYIGADHRGFQLKAKIIDDLKRQGHEVFDEGTHEEGACDYPEISYQVASGVAKSPGARGILICMTGLGHVICANKVLGAYAALCYNVEAAKFSRMHNNSNVLVLGALFSGEDQVQKIIQTWLTTDFETGGRHERRVNQIKEIEKRTLGQKT